MAWNCCGCSSYATTTSAAVVPAIYAAARTRNRFAITLSKQHVSSQLRSRGIARIRALSSNFRARSKATEKELEISPSSSDEIDCIGTGLNVECVVTPSDDLSGNPNQVSEESGVAASGLFELAGTALEWGLLISPFFFWGTAMVAMKEVLPKTGPFLCRHFGLFRPGSCWSVSRLPEAVVCLLESMLGCLFQHLHSLMLHVFRRRVMGSLFRPYLTDGEQGFLAEGLERTTAGLGSVIIDSQPLTVAILASLFFGESIGYIGVAGLVLGVLGLLLLEVPLLHLTLITSLCGEVGSGGCFLLHKVWPLALLWFAGSPNTQILLWQLDGFIYLGETFTSVQLVGAVITVAAIYMVNYKNGTD
ncbi:hypothetical protein DH2020_013715 [Rehmannia glutinosa]|uniref:EamA domain-containing protein n=1 Tax=Rehmannia glutinosa TaxID=99300 RepID=A0ABR0X4E2_REHGL